MMVQAPPGARGWLALQAALLLALAAAVFFAVRRPAGAATRSGAAALEPWLAPAQPGSGVLAALGVASNAAGAASERAASGSVSLMGAAAGGAGGALPGERGLSSSPPLLNAELRARQAAGDDPIDLLRALREVRKALKIFVYELPSKFNSIIAVRHPYCAPGAFGTEIYIHEQLLLSEHRTLNPEEAHLFFVPVYSACVVYQNFRHFPTYRRLIGDAIHHIIHNEPYWNRTRGRDHVWAFVHDYGGCLSWHDNLEHIYYRELRNSIFLSHNGDLDMGCFQTYKDLVIPPMSSNPLVIKEGRGGADQNATLYPKTTFAYFRGTVKWYHVNDLPALRIQQGYSPTYSHGIRQALQKLYRDDPLFAIHEGASDNYPEEIRRSTFCICPRGFAAWSQRLYDSIMLGCIPVVISDQIELPFEDVIDYRKFIVKVDDRDIYRLREILTGIPQHVIEAKQRYLRRVWKIFSYQRPVSEEGDAFDTILSMLWLKVRTRLPVGPDSWVD
jgi:hypothetical protein